MIVIVIVINRHHHQQPPFDLQRLLVAGTVVSSGERRFPNEVTQ